MVTIIKMNNQNFLFDRATGEKVIRWDETNKNICLRCRLSDGSILTVENEQLKRKHGGDVYFEYKDDMYIVDDGYQCVMIQCGYLVADDYDKYFIMDKEGGYKLRDENILAIREICFSKEDEDETVQVETFRYTTTFSFRENGYKYIIVFDPASRIVNRNLSRKINKLPYYPFDKKMDKYGTMYVSVFCQRYETGADNSIKFTRAKEFIYDFLDKLNQKKEGKHSYHYVAMDSSKRIIYDEVM